METPLSTFWFLENLNDMYQSQKVVVAIADRLNSKAISTLQLKGLLKNHNKFLDYEGIRKALIQQGKIGVIRN